jgi:hypothetical protein
MDLFGDASHNAERMKEFLEVPLLLSQFENSTCSVNGFLSNLQFDEEDLIPFIECNDKIVGIDCNFGHKVKPGYTSTTNPRRSNRGRKKKEKVKKNRKYQGDGSSFNSQITFIVLGTHIRKVPFVEDKRSQKAIKLVGGKEQITKEYKIKVFRNGSITIPGILTEDMSDVKAPLEEVCKCLSSVLCTETQLVAMYSVMRNYKCILLDGKIDIRNLQQFCERHFQHLLNTRFSDIVEFLINPAFEEADVSPLFEGWNEVLAADVCLFETKESRADSPEPISFSEMHRYLYDSMSTKNLYVDFDKLTTKIRSYRLGRIYYNLQIFYNVLTEEYHALTNDSYRRICYYLIESYIRDLEIYLTKSKDNLLSHIKYDPEKYPGFLIKIKTPNLIDKEKKTTIKVFPSGKINIDGANSRTEAEFIYYWFNWVLYKNPQLIYHGDFDYDGPDSEFSSDSEDF